MRTPHLAIVAAALVFTAACGGASSSPTSPAESSGPLSFTVAPVDPSSIQYILALGNMGPWAHTLPTDHAYIYHHLNSGAFTPINVLAPAAGTISNTYPGVNGEVKVWVRVSTRYTYYFDHVVLTPGLGTGAHVDAGSVIGVSLGIAFDFAVTDQNTTQGFLTPARYGMDTLYAQSPFPYFVEPIRSALYAKVQRSGGDLDGKINYDVAGTLSGNWFAEDLPVSQSGSGDSNTGTRQMAFARDVRFPDRQQVSIGGFNFTGIYGVPPGAPDFAAVTPASGFVLYRLLNTGEPNGPAGTTQTGLLLVQLIDTQHLRVEVINDQQSTTATFSSAAVTYVR